jgi:glycosyltransferase involved in cell wall biosynthesis
VNVIYVSYDGALDPLGASQVVPYVLGLSRCGVNFTLLSFEKAQRWNEVAPRQLLANRLLAAGIHWIPLAYHPRPRLPAKVWDIMAGGRVIAGEVLRTAASLVHCRGDMAMAMVRLVGLPRTTRILYDIRGFFSEERVEGGSWSRTSLLDHAVRRLEAGSRRRADGIVVLTEAALRHLAEIMPALPPHEVIPTCVDLTTFSPRDPGIEADYGLVYCGSLGTWYMAQEVADFARMATHEIPGRTLFLTPQVSVALDVGVSEDWADVRSLPPSEVPLWLRRCRAAVFFYKPGIYAMATFPTKFAEAIATGLPVVVNRGIGDLDRIVEAERVGVLVDGFSEVAYRTALGRIRDLLRDPGTAARCRLLAERRFGIDSGVAQYRGLYERISALGPEP